MSSEHVVMQYLVLRVQHDVASCEHICSHTTTCRSVQHHAALFPETFSQQHCVLSAQHHDIYIFCEHAVMQHRVLPAKHHAILDFVNI
jgi:hypothetical protein